MTLAQPTTFTLTDQEAATLQAAQMARHLLVTGTSPVIRFGSVAVPAALVAAIFAIDFVWYDGQMSAGLFVTMMALFVAGMMTTLLAHRLSLQTTKRRMREKTRQLFEPRTIRLTDEGIEQSLPELRSVHLWPGIDRVEQHAGLIFAWAGNLLVSAIPERAFASPQDAQAFVAACKNRANVAGR